MILLTHLYKTTSKTFFLMLLVSLQVLIILCTLVVMTTWDARHSLPGVSIVDSNVVVTKVEARLGSHMSEIKTGY